MAKAKIAGKLTTVNQHELQDSGLDMLRLALFNEITPREGTSGIDNNLVYMESRHADMPETAQIDALVGRWTQSFTLLHCRYLTTRKAENGRCSKLCI